MERTKWTDDMLDQRFASMDDKFDLLFPEIRELRREMRDGFANCGRSCGPRSGSCELRWESCGLGWGSCKPRCSPYTAR
jgi:hypothetical protein